MKQYIIPVVVAVLITLLLTGFGTNRYYKSAEKQLKEQYETKLAKNDSIAKVIELENAKLKLQQESDAKFIAKQTAEVDKLKKQNSNLSGDLVAAKDKIKDFTAGEAVKYFEDYAKIADNKMLVDGSDTAVVVSIPSIKKVDNIFAEHKNFGLKIATLDQIILKQDGTIIIQANSISLYKRQVDNKDAEIALIKDSGRAKEALWQLDLNKYRSQRNRARTALYGTGAVVVGAIVIKVLLK